MLLKNNATGGGSTPTKRVVLPELAKPIHYDLVLAPDFTTFKFDGRVAIGWVETPDTGLALDLRTRQINASRCFVRLTVLKETAEIVLNVTYQEIHSAKIVVVTRADLT